MLRPVAEKLITKAKKGDLHNRREVLKTIRDKSVVHALFTEIAPDLRRASGWLHPDHQDRSPQGRQRPDGGHRAGDRGLQAAVRARSAHQEGRSGRGGRAAEAGRGPRRGRGRRHRRLRGDRGRTCGKYAGSHVPLEDAAEAPEGFPIKGNEDSMKYHAPDGQWFEQTDRRGLVRLRGVRRGRRLHQGRRVAPPRRRQGPSSAWGGGPSACRGGPLGCGPQPDGRGSGKAAGGRTRAQEAPCVRGGDPLHGASAHGAGGEDARHRGGQVGRRQHVAPWARSSATRRSPGRSRSPAAPTRSRAAGWGHPRRPASAGRRWSPRPRRRSGRRSRGRSGRTHS